MAKQRIILHVDMDSFYASVEERENPSLKGKPVVVGADPKFGKGRGVVSTCNYKAREFGIKSGMPISRAYKLCKDCIFLPVRMDLYKAVSEDIMQIIRKYSPKTQQASIDESYIDMTGIAKSFKDAESAARKIKKEMLEKEKLTCSVGIGPNKLIAKIASDMKKPDGLTSVKPDKVIDFISGLSVRKIHGIGPKTQERLKELGIETVSQLSKASQEMLIQEFGSHGHEMHLLSKGIDTSEVAEKEGIKSISRLRTFEQDTKEEKQVFSMIESLASMVHDELSQRGLFYKTVTLTVKFEDFDVHSAAKSMKVGVNSMEGIAESAKELARQYLLDRRKIRQVGIRLSSFADKENQKQLV